VRFPSSFYGAEARVLGMLYQRNIQYLAILKQIARKMGGRVPKEYRALVMQHAYDKAETLIQ